MDWTKVPYYILDLIQQVPAVSVPQLGRFEAILHPSVIDLPGQEVRPPHLEAVFVPADMAESDLLTAYIRYVSGASAEDAESAVRTFAAHVQEETREGRNLSIDNFGTFSRHEDDVLRFTPDWDAFNLTFSQLRPVSLAAPAPAPAASLAEYPPPGLPAAEVSNATLPEPENAISIQQPEEVSPPAQPLSIPLSHEDEATDVSARMWWGILITALALITVLCAYLVWDIVSNRDRILRLMQAQTPPPIVRDTPPPAVALPVDTAQVDVPIKPAQPEPQVPSETDEPPCYVVVGAFSSIDNVIRMEERLASMGYPYERIEGGSITRVAIRADCAADRLQEVLNDARARIHPEAWIY